VVGVLAITSADTQVGSFNDVNWLVIGGSFGQAPKRSEPNGREFGEREREREKRLALTTTVGVNYL
jgi:hypothetical protein